MGGLIPVGVLAAASDITVGALVDQEASKAQRAVDRRVEALAGLLVAEAVADDETVAAAAATAADGAVASKVAGLSLAKTDVLVTNYALNPIPRGSVSGWVSENTGLYTVALGADEAVVTRSSTGPFDFRAVLRTIGMLANSQVIPAGTYTVSVEVWTDIAARVVAYKEFPGANIPAKTWTRVYGTLVSTGASMTGPAIAIAEATGATTAGAVTKFRKVMLSPGTVPPRAGNGSMTGWQWNGPADQSTSSGVPVTPDGLASGVRSGRGGMRIVPLGDSTTIANSTVAPTWGSRDFWVWALILSGGAFKLVRNAGIAGNKTAEMLARFDGDVTPYNPTDVPIIAGINDAVAGVALATYQANIRELVAKVRRIGARPWLGNVAPNLNTGAVQQRIATFNAWLAEFAATEGIPLVDINSVLTDPATGKYLAQYDLDGTHQNVAGAKAIAQQIVKVVKQILPAWSPSLPTSNTADQLNLITNGLFLIGSPTPTGWLNTGGTVSVVADTTIKGNWARIADNGAGTATLRFESPNLAGAVSGDNLSFVGRIRQVKGSSVTSTRVFLRFVGPNIDHDILWLNTETIEGGVFAMDVVVPVGATAFQVQVARTCTTAGDGYTEIAQVGLFNKTVMGTLA